ncbi:MAG: hypothetical protein A4E62_00070 [Syntrophorhabdus sp. PtaU1.Bin002]|nr:MAG: hypothetical protein A4E62_00070 [Syntrophorhabdus sp. PtaU1.Bin002]
MSIQRNDHAVFENFNKTTSLKTLFSVYESIVSLPKKTVNCPPSFDVPDIAVSKSGTKMKVFPSNALQLATVRFVVWCALG